MGTEKEPVGEMPAGSVVGASGFEPPASASRTLRANQAALRPDYIMDSTIPHPPAANATGTFGWGGLPANEGEAPAGAGSYGLVSTW